MSLIERVSVRVPVIDVVLAGDMEIPHDAKGIVVFAHGRGSSRHSPRDRRVAALLRHAGLATLLLDLLTEDEEEQERLYGGYRFNTDLLARRLAATTDWLLKQPAAHGLPIGYFGARTGAGAAINAAVERPDAVRAIVSRGGRPDLAGEGLTRLTAPILLVVGGDDAPVIRVNEDALEVIRAPKRLAIVRGASHLFEEPGALDQVARLAHKWFVTHLAEASTSGTWAGPERRHFLDATWSGPERRRSLVGP